MAFSRFERAGLLGLGALFLLPTCPAVAHADAGVPMMALMAVPMWASLLAIIPLEAWVATRRLGTSWGRSLRVSAIANLVSTVAGVPLTWIVLTVGELGLTGLGSAFAPRGHLYPHMLIGEVGERMVFFFVTSPWLYPDENALYWMVPAAALLLLVPFFFASVWIEYRVARRMLGRDQAPRILAWAWRANMVSYILLALVPAAWLGHNLLHHRMIALDERHRPVDLVPAERLWDLAVARTSQPATEPNAWADPSGEERPRHMTRADSLWRGGLDAHRSGDDRTAESRWRAALDELDHRRIAGVPSGRAEVSVETLLESLAGSYVAHARYTDAIPLYERLVATSDSALESGRFYAHYPPELVAAYDSAGHPERAEALCQRLVDCENRLALGDPDALDWASSALASHRLARGDSSRAEALYRKAIGVARRTSSWCGTTAGMQAYRGLSALYRRQKRLPEAKALLEDGIRLRSSTYGHGEFTDSTSAGPLFLDLGLVFLDQGALPQATHCIKSALRWDSRLRETAEAYAQVLERQGRAAEAGAWRERARTARQ